MSRFSRFAGLLIATVLIPLVGTAVFPGPLGASQPRMLHGDADTPAGTHFAGAITSGANGSDVDGRFTLKIIKGGDVTVLATCLDVFAIGTNGGRGAGAAGRVAASSDASFPLGTAIGVHAFESPTSPHRDGLSLYLLPKVPGPNQCNPPSSAPAPIARGRISIRL
jgi:hypothetical protein